MEAIRSLQSRVRLGESNEYELKEWFGSLTLAYCQGVCIMQKVYSVYWIRSVNVRIHYISILGDIIGKYITLCKCTCRVSFAPPSLFPVP